MTIILRFNFSLLRACVELRLVNMKSFLVFLILSFLKLLSAQKCSKVFDNRNVTQIIECTNVMSMNDIANEIQSDWIYVKIKNSATHTQFSNSAGKIKKFQMTHEMIQKNLINCFCL